MRKIKFNNPEEVYEFVKEIQKLDCDVDIIDGRIRIDAKSLLGVMNLDLRKTFEIEAISEDSDVLDKILNLRKE